MTKHKIRCLIAAWFKGTMNMSSPTSAMEHPCAVELLAVGRPAISPLLNELRLRPSIFVCIMLAEIVGADAPLIAPEDYGRVRAISQEWIKWGRTRGHLPQR